MNKLYISSSCDPYHNLSIEEYLFDTNKSDTILFLWQNDNTVVIGKHQNLFREVNISEASKDQVKLSRRTTGGGAVYHDLGNLNYSIIVPSEEKNICKQMQIITDALKQLNINASVSGRNDILVKNRKFSGNAFRDSRRNHLHHGTIMVQTDFDRLSKYLTPSKIKLSTKGFSSVRSRVINLSDLSPSLSIDSLSYQLRNSYENLYGKCTLLDNSLLDYKAIKKLEIKNSSYEWIYGNTPAYNMQIETNLSFGEISVILNIDKKGIIETAEIYTDAMNVGFFDDLKRSLPGMKLNMESIKETFETYYDPEAEEIEKWFNEILS